MYIFTYTCNIYIFMHSSHICIPCKLQGPVHTTLCNTLQHIQIFVSPYALTTVSQSTATHCNTLQHTATHCTTPRHTAPRCNTLQNTATHCNTLPFLQAASAYIYQWKQAYAFEKEPHALEKEPYIWQDLAVGASRDGQCSQKRALEKKSYGVATISRLLKIIGLFCRRAL